MAGDRAVTKFRKHLILLYYSFVAGVAWASFITAQAAPVEGPASATPLPLLPPLSPPVIEVAAFRVAPVSAMAGGTADTRSKNQPGGSLLQHTAGNDLRVRELRTQKSDTWDELLQRAATLLGLKPLAVVQTRQAALPPLLPGKFVRAQALPGGAMDLEYVVTPNEAYAVQITGASVQVRPLAADPRLVERMRADPAKASLFTATYAIGLPESIALQLTEIFAGEVDFLRELHQGYRCAIVYEAHYREGFIDNAGRILAAELEIGARLYRAYYAPDTNGQGRYFDASGKSAQRVFRRAPLEFTRITSDYTLARFHPILGVWTAHLGVDYAAPTGTKVMSVADGVVDFAGPRGGYGNLVIVRHQDKFLTYYAHLNAFAPKLAAGDKVAQGQTIGFVGMTGLATGPHLHFEFHARSVSGQWVSVRAPDVVDTTQVAAAGFAERVKTYHQGLSVVGQGNYLFLE